MTVHGDADGESFLLVAEHVGELLNEGQAKTALAETPGSRFVEDSRSLLENQRFEEYLEKIKGHLDLVFSKCNDKDCECVANTLVQCATHLPEDRIPITAHSLATALVSKADERSEERFGALLNLYGSTHGFPKVQREILLKAADYARTSARLASILVPAVRGKSQEWIRQWGLNEAESRELLIGLASLVKIGTDKASVQEYASLINMALALCRDGDRVAIAQLRPLAVAAVTDFIRSPSIFQADFASSPAVKALGSDPGTAPLYAVFAATLSADLGSFRKAATPQVLEQVGVSGEAALTKARLVALVALCSDPNRKEVSFSSIQAALDIPPESVEAWVVRAIGAKLIEGKMDQVQGSISVARCTQLSFGAKEWVGVRDQLRSWREMMHSTQQLLGSLQSSAARSAEGVPAVVAAI